MTISGGHILSNVYGANEYTTVQGKSTVTMTGGTIGVPRTQEQIAADPKIGHLFGGGKGFGGPGGPGGRGGFGGGRPRGGGFGGRGFGGPRRF